MKSLELERFSWLSRRAPSVIVRVHAGKEGGQEDQRRKPRTELEGSLKRLPSGLEDRGGAKSQGMQAASRS